MKQQCENCRFWEDFGMDFERGRQGRCRASPPSVAYKTSRRPKGVWPFTDPHSWCGKWEATEGGDE